MAYRQANYQYETSPKKVKPEYEQIKKHEVLYTLNKYLINIYCCKRLFFIYLLYQKFFSFSNFIG